MEKQFQDQIEKIKKRIQQDQKNERWRENAKERIRLEKLYGPLPYNYFDLSSSEQNELLESNIMKRAEEIGPLVKGSLLDYQQESQVKSIGIQNNKEIANKLTEIPFFRLVLIILFWGLVIWALNEGGWNCGGVDRSGPLRR